MKRVRRGRNSGEARSNEGNAQADSNEANAVDQRVLGLSSVDTISTTGDRQLPRSGAIFTT